MLERIVGEEKKTIITAGTSYKSGAGGRKGVEKGSSLLLTFIRLGNIISVMSRPLRIEYPGAWYHVMNWGRRREDIFLSPADYGVFIEVLRKTVESWNLKVAAYCLMSNHYHLLVHTPDGNISRCMRHLNGVYTQRFNRCHKKEDQLFRGRYKAVLVDADSHLLEVLHYLHNNPLRAGISHELNDYSWSSHQEYLSKSKKWAWLYKDFLLTMIATSKGQQQAAYVEFVSHGDSEEIERFYGLKNLPSILGGDSFKDWVKEKFNNLVFQQEVPESRTLAPVADDIISEVCKYFKVSKEEIAVSKRGTENLPRDIAIYFVRRCCRKTLSEVGRYFGISNYSTVSSAAERIKARKSEDGKLQKQPKSIGAKLNKSQEQT
ncbi:transposase [Thermodesulfovibrionales bacterium]|nr:transposase [Thermodesulfovibrionales bacterium]